MGTLLLLYQLGEFQRLDHLVPGCQSHLLDTEGLMPPPTRELLQDLISRNAPHAGSGG
ncbi:hypothetical protein ACGFZK_07535 [Streptomyces sp. NPDC048257]|uniref:hypothetical protein n=1 Tax=Streptomyces sp. NPDC048257 TaxID=3365526 RepID=UPI003713F206